MCMCTHDAALFLAFLLARAAPGCVRKHAFGFAVTIWIESLQTHNTHPESEREPEQRQGLFLIRHPFVCGRGKKHKDVSWGQSKNIEKHSNRDTSRKKVEKVSC